MATPNRYLNQGERLAWVRWECIRRTSEYQTDWKGFDAQFRRWFEENGYWWDNRAPIYSDQSWFFFCSQVAPVAKAICERWKIVNPFPPTWKFGRNCLKKERGVTVVIPTLNGEGTQHAWNLKAIDPAQFPNRVDRAREASRGVQQRIGRSWTDTDHPRYLRLEIDLKEPLQQILEQVESKVDSAKRFYVRTIGPMHDKGEPLRIQDADDYATYLRVWDLRQEGKTFKEIATLLFPKEMSAGNRLNPTVDRVRAQHKRACELMKWATEK
jgi:hypothetical protein